MRWEICIIANFFLTISAGVFKGAVSHCDRRRYSREPAVQNCAKCNDQSESEVPAEDAGGRAATTVNFDVNGFVPDQQMQEASLVSDLPDIDLHHKVPHSGVLARDLEARPLYLLQH